MAKNSAGAERGSDCGLAGRKPLIPENIKDELDMVYHFTQEFKSRYGETHMPAFRVKPLESVLENAKNSPVRERKPIAVYLHHDNSSLSDLFCSKGLCSADVATYLNNNYVIFGWDMTSPKIRKRIRRPLSQLMGYSLALQVKELREKELPLLLTLTFIHTSRGVDPDVISYINGASNESDILNCLIQTKKVFDDNHAIALQRLEEKECRDSVWRNNVWGIPWKHKILEPVKKEEDQKSYFTPEEMKKAPEELEHIVRDGNLDKLQAICDQGGDLSGYVTTPYHEKLTMCLLSLAAWNGHTHLLNTLIESGLSVEGSGTTNWKPLMLAARQGHEKMVEELLSCGANPLARDSEEAVALHHAAFCGQMHCVAALCPVTPTTITDSQGRMPIHAASLRGHKHVIEYLNDKGWKLGVADSEGNTELHMSAWFGSLEVVEYLVAAKLDPHQKNKDGLTALNFAVRKGHHNIESWFMKSQGGFSLKLLKAHQLVKSQEEYDKDSYQRFKRCVEFSNVAGIKEINVVSDAHLMDEKGMTLLHWALEENYVRPSVVARLLDIVHPHVMTYDGLTPLDMAKKKLKLNEGTSFYPRYEEAISILENHQCSKEEGSPEELYIKLLKVISEEDNVKKVSCLLCAGAPLELIGDFPNSALQQAITNGHSRIVSLMLALQASLIPCTQGLNLLQHAWYSPNTSASIYGAITKAFSRELKRERKRLLHHTSGLRSDLAALIEAVDGNAPWEACWKMGNSKKENLGDMTTVDQRARWEACWQKGRTAKKTKFNERTACKLTSFMVTATLSNCPLIASFLQRAGAWPYFSTAGTTPLHAALKTGNLNLVETMVRNLGASLYIPDSEHSLPKDIMEKMDVAKLKKLEEEVYMREKRKLENLKIHTKDESEKEKVQMLVDLQETLFNKYTGNTDTVHPAPGNSSSIDHAYAMLVASRSGLQQLLHLLLVIECLPVDLVVDWSAGTTALHEAASHGESGCVVLLLHSLEKAAVANKHNVAKAKAFSGNGHSVTWKFNRYSPLQPDRYGQTALHLAAMFGHKHTLELLVHFVGEDPPCRAGTTAMQIHSNFTGYLRRYLRYNDRTKNTITPLDHHDPDSLLRKLLYAVDLDELPRDVKRANVDMDSGEARQVKDAVLKAVGVILGRVVMTDDMYQGRVRLVGSARDGSKLFAPDEFDINVVIPATDRVNILVEQEMDVFKGNVLKINVETNNPHLQGNRLMGDLFNLIKDVLTDSVLHDDRLSVVPPSLTRTQVGVALAMAWQGFEYPLLLVGVDLVPVLEVPWHEAIVKPSGLTPPDTHNMHISNTSDGSWRCSFGLLEAEVLSQLSLEERCIQLSCKMLLYHLKAEPWMPREIKALSTWWSGRPFKASVPSGFCLKSSFFEVLACKQKCRWEWSEGDTIKWMVSVFKKMCLVEKESKTLSPKKVFAYFGGDCEGPKFGQGAPIITKYLMEKGLKRKYIKRSFRQHLNYWINTFSRLTQFFNMR